MVAQQGGPRVALVLGAAVWSGGRASPTLRRRALHAAALWQAGEVSVILASGGVGRHGPSEAAVIAALCRKAGVPEVALVLEDRSTSTEENLRLSLPLLRRIGAGEVVVVTDGFHAPRARLAARRLGFVQAVGPVQSDSPRVPLSLNRVKAGLREVPAYLWYALRLRG
ncbi:YdcF family protein [Salipiger mangrovisoli]|uniref:YdcF family protein n=1 Tax=Salipiger mangrovisoli TaxID=2865933 RepID=A0ABR9X2J5_9RHOB|nr:YdcF family protein [Salipiger mangrovisoli]MBE9637782.1 YdcF family protein [Salipiger mangrovisoli]